MAAHRAMRCPVVVILGATGTGKSKLSLDIARIFKGEIISADSMQVYKGLDIITAKVRPEEQRQVPHHLIDCVSPLRENSTIVDFRNRAIPIIDSLLQRGQMPVVVGGTFYYIESLLWKYLINEEDVEKASAGVSTLPTSEASADDLLSQPGREPDVAEPTGPDGQSRVPAPSADGQRAGPDNHRRDFLAQADGDNSVTDKRADEHSSSSSDSDDEMMTTGGAGREKYKDKTATELYHMLLQVDSVTARKLHPRDRRKIMRALEVYDQHGMPMSEIYEHQHRDVGSDRAVSGPLRYPDTCIFWIQCQPDVLEERLVDRVDAMMDQGLVKELTDFHTQYNAQRLAENKEADYTRGIFQSIGFKEFHDYLVLSDEERNTEKGKQLLQTGTEDLKAMTRRYARRQVRWIRNRLLKRPSSNVLPMYALDGTDVSRWDELVTQPAVGVIESLLQGEKPSLEPLPYEGERTEEYVYNICKTCDKTFVLESIWKGHLRSKRHRKRVAGHRKLLKNTAYILDKAIQEAKRRSSSDETHPT